MEPFHAEELVLLIFQAWYTTVANTQTETIIYFKLFTPTINTVCQLLSQTKQMGFIKGKRDRKYLEVKL